MPVVKVCPVWRMAPVFETRRYHLIDKSAPTARSLTTSCNLYHVLSRIGYNGAFKYLHSSTLVYCPCGKTNNSERQKSGKIWVSRVFLNGQKRNNKLAVQSYGTRQQYKGDGYARAAATIARSTLRRKFVSSRVVKTVKASHSARADATAAVSRDRRGSSARFGA